VSCLIASHHAARYEGTCECSHCMDECDCDDDFDADELGLDPEEEYDA